mmetsp:Transcript_42558/g.117415  ORF Transcript_42558/g.117415 Transcript_42558/m.117415 type:complete len:85 (-) Transcript_42558:737-991(-)
MLSAPRLDIRLQLNHGVLVVLLLVFLVFQVVELLAQDRVPSVTCAVEVICSVQQEFGVTGTKKSALTNADTLFLLLLLHLLYLL